jgi:hypothetical protein
MKRLLSLSLVLCPALVACSGGSSTSHPAADNSSGGGSPSTTSAGTTTGGTTTSSGSGGADGATVTLQLESFKVPVGAEVYKCQNFKNPFDADVDIQEFESHMTPGSHHLLLFYRPDVTADAPLADCSGLEFAATPYNTQLPDDSMTYPEGVAGIVPKGTGLRVQSHYLNTTGSEITAQVSVTLHLAKDGTVQQHAGELFVFEPNIHVLPGMTGVVHHDCKLPYDMNLLKVGSHMHKHGTNFEATIAGETVFQTTAWSDPKPAEFSPPKLVHAGDPLSFSCTFVNNGTKELTVGESAQTDEMCIFAGQYYPIPDKNHITVDCN